MSALSVRVAQVRADVVATLRAAGITAYGHNPEVYDLPCVFVGPGDPWLDYDQAVFGGVFVNTVAVVIVPAGDNERMASDLDLAVAGVLDVLDAADRDVMTVDTPGRVDLPTGTHLGAVIRLSPYEIHTT